MTHDLDALRATAAKRTLSGGSLVGVVDESGDLLSEGEEVDADGRGVVGLYLRLALKRETNEGQTHLDGEDTGGGAKVGLGRDQRGGSVVGLKGGFSGDEESQVGDVR
jgi:hypothetical protein